ncbi:MAG TPA: YdeI/OmpD-associated family protein [Candidatus Sulfotelmatobacter sp.]|nr:YdeI/OmpD-associated family protein [Candidatus Sulfotelmatobacter sp.]
MPKTSTKPSREPKPQFFPTLADWRAWLEKHHANTEEFWVGFYKRDSGRPSITWPESVDGALCFGWIDGVRKSIDATSYKIRFTPRKPRSIWSAINIKRAKELSKQRLMHAAGLAAFEKRDGNRSAIYAYEQRKTAKLPSEFDRQFRTNPEAWTFFQSQPPWYQRTSTYWVISAKKEETRVKRLAILIDCSTRKQKIPTLNRDALGGVK